MVLTAKTNMLPGEDLSGFTAYTSLADHPRWMRFKNASGVEGKAALPSGFRRAVGYSASGRKSTEYQVVPELPDILRARNIDQATGQPWRVIVSTNTDDGDSCFIVSDGSPMRTTKPVAVNDISTARSTQGAFYLYTFDKVPATVTGAQTYDRVYLNPTDAMDQNGATEEGKLYIMPMPDQNGAPEYLPGTTLGGSKPLGVLTRISGGATSGTVDVHVTVEYYLFEAIPTYGETYYICRAKQAVTEDYTLGVGVSQLSYFTCNVQWELPKNARLGIRYTFTYEVSEGGEASPSVYFKTSTTNYFFRHGYYRMFDADADVGESLLNSQAEWPVSPYNLPEIAIEYVGKNASTPSLANISHIGSTQLAIRTSDVPNGPSATIGNATMATTDKGAYMRIAPVGDPEGGIISVPLTRVPEVRLTDSAPSKAVIQYAISPDAHADPFNAGFAGWLSTKPNSADGYGYGAAGRTGPITRGMELTVEYRNAATGTLDLAFRGRIFEIERSTEGITVTAYDRLMDLANYSDQYTPTSLPTTEVSGDRTINTDYYYKFGQDIGTVVDAQTYDRIEVDALGAMSNQGIAKEKLYIMPMPDQNGAPGYVPGTALDSITVRVIMGHNPYASGVKITSNIEVLLIEQVGSSYVCRRRTDKTTVKDPVPGTHEDNITISGLGWTLPENAKIGIRYTWTYTSSGFSPSPYYTIKTSTTSHFFDHGAYRVYDGDASEGSVISYADTASAGSDVPEPALQYIGYSYVHIATANVSVSGQNAIIAAGNIPPGPSYSSGGATMTTLDAGVMLWLVYYGTEAIDILATAQELIRNAGLDVGTVQGALGSTSYYTSSTYDYLTCVRELIKAGNLGIRERIVEAGVIDILPKHTLDEIPVLNVSTADDADEHIIIQHQITSRWMAEKATVAIIAEDATASGLPIALETDDELMDNSLAGALDTPLRQIITDRSMGTHALLANAAGGRMVQLHTNVFEGQLVLAGYRLDVWDLTGSGAGGQPIGVTIPEADASGTALPTEVTFTDGATVVKLDNIRTADRSEVANSMGLTADGLSNNTTALPSTVYIFARYWDYDCQELGGVTVTPGQSMNLLAADNTVLATISAGPYLKHIDDVAGYHHIAGIIPGSASPIADTKPIALVAYDGLIAAVDNPKYALANQGVHIDLRVPRA